MSKRQPKSEHKPAERAKPDPIFAAIEAHQRAWSQYDRDCSKLDEAASAGDERAAQKLNMQELAVSLTSDALVNVVPTTLADVTALLKYAADQAVDRRDRWPGTYTIADDKGRERSLHWETVLHMNLAEALAKIAA